MWLTFEFSTIVFHSNYNRAQQILFQSKADILKHNYMFSFDTAKQTTAIDKKYVLAKT